MNGADAGAPAMDLDVLKPEDQLFVRVILHNGLLSPGDVASAQETYERERVRSSFKKYLLAAGLISTRTYRAVNQALEGRGVRGAPAADTGSKTARLRPTQMAARSDQSRSSRSVSGRSRTSRRTAIKRQRLWRPRSQRMSEAFERARQRSDGEDTTHKLEPVKARRDALDEEELTRLIRKYVPTRLHARLLEALVTHRQEVFGVKDMAAKVGVSEDVVDGICQRWRHFGILRLLGIKAYNYCPPASLRRQLDLFLRDWKDTRTRGDLMHRLLVSEQNLRNA
jgi:hypothetical protein